MSLVRKLFTFLTWGLVNAFIFPLLFVRTQVRSTSKNSYVSYCTFTRTLGAASGTENACSNAHASSLLEFLLISHQIEYTRVNVTVLRKIYRDILLSYWGYPQKVSSIPQLRGEKLKVPTSRMLTSKVMKKSKVRVMLAI